MGCVESSLSSSKPAIFLNGKVIEIIPKNCSHKQLQDQYRVSVATTSSSSSSSSSSPSTISPYVSLQPYSAEGDHHLCATQHFIVSHRDLKKIERDNSSSSGGSFTSPNSIGPTSLSSLQDKSDKTKREKVAFSPLLSPHRSLDSRGGSGMGLILFDSSFENPNQSYTLFEHPANGAQRQQHQQQQTQSSYSIACYSSQEKKHYFWSVQDGNRLSLIPSPASGQISDQEKFFFNVVASSPASISPSPSSLAFTSSQNSSSLSSPQKSARGKEDEVESKNQQQQRPLSPGSNLSTSSVDDPTTAKATLPHVLSERFPSDVEEESDNEQEEIHENGNEHHHHQTKGKHVENMNNNNNSSSSSTTTTITRSSTSSASNNTIQNKNNSSFTHSCNSKYQDPMTQNLSTTPLGETSFF